MWNNRRVQVVYDSAPWRFLARDDVNLHAQQRPCMLASGSIFVL